MDEERNWMLKCGFWSGGTLLVPMELRRSGVGKNGHCI
jgi:hypothetical protein